MAVLALAVAGAALAPAGYAAIGWTVGQVVGQLLFPGKLPDQVGPRIGDLRAQQSQYGAAIPILFGTVRVAGNVIWSTPLLETVNTTRVGGKGAPSQTQTTYSYRVSMAVMLGEGPVLGIRRIWADGKLIYDVGANADILTAMASNALAPGIEFYPGNESQMPDPTMETYLGVGQVPAYRGRAYLVFTDLQLEAYGNRRPNITCEVVATGSLTSQTTYATPPGVSGITQYDSIATDGDTLIALDLGAPARISRSADGLTWSPISGLPSTGNGNCIFWANGVWVILCTNDLCWSTDGINWTLVTSAQGAPTGGTSVAWNGVRFVAIGPNATWSTSISGQTWTSQAVPAVRDWREVVWTGTLFVALAGDGTTAYSPDGLAWTLGAIGFGGQWRSIASAGSHLVAVQNSTGSAARSTDGVAWSAITLPASAGYNRVRWIGEYYIAVRGGTLNAFARSFTGATWEDFPQAQNFGMTNLVARGGTAFVVNRQTPPNQRVITLRLDIINPGAVTLASILSNICQRAGLQPSDFDVSGLADMVDGFAVGQQMSARAAIEMLQAGFNFDTVESDGKAVFRTRGGSVVATIPEGDLAAYAAGDDLPDDLTITRQQEPELPAVVSVVHIDPASDYQQNTQQAQRTTTLSRQQAGIELAIVMSADRARAIAEAALYNAWTQRVRYRFTTSRAYAALEPSDVVAIARGGTTHTVRLERKVESRSGVIAWDGVAEEASVYTQSATGGSGSAGQTTVRSAPATILVPMDLPMLRDQDDDGAFYVAAAGAASGWRGTVLYRSADGGATYDEVGAMAAEATIGFTVGSLWNNAFHPNTFDEGTLINVELRRGTFSSATELAVLEGGANYVLVGSEILQFRSAVMYAQDTYQLSGLLRGRRGTEWAMSGHAASGETVVLLSAATLRRYASDLSAARLYKPVSIGRTVQQTVAQAFTYTGINRLPFAPVQLGAGRNAANDITLAWLRRSRQGVSLPWNYDPPLGETSELYDLEVWNAAFSVLRRTFSNLTTPTVTYTAAQQAADSGGVLSSYGIRVFQRNAVLGRGYVLQGII